MYRKRGKSKNDKEEKNNHINSTLFTLNESSNSLNNTHLKVEFSTEPDKMPGEGDQAANIDFHNLTQAQKDDSVLIIDVREPSEINETGQLPGSINIPMANVLTTLNLSNEEFQNQFKKPKPEKNTKIILSCRSGMRSGKVQKELQKNGYNNTFNYVGGWLEWESKTKK
ncbi:rhodanese domain-containing protein CG4456-like isoform X2 [Chelonus insularis]|uniref:rhodanese domain-containing protein CG4456-like isoform X2 n=1 Tax=Chelonus insularis TaxID=460826 RepID=UPI00158D5711|nr:rhodanese domain-containing protein CG4456-like isoform X2 [Chelonus insularis]